MWVPECWWFVQELPGKGITPDLRALARTPAPALPIRDAGFLGRAADYGGGASGSLGVKDDSNRLKVSAAPSPVMADEASIVRGAPQEPGPVKISSTQLLALAL
jgi:hypothetical protein